LTLPPALTAGGRVNRQQQPPHPTEWYHANKWTALNQPDFVVLGRLGLIRTTKTNVPH